MATAISVRPVSTGPRMRRPPQHSLHTTVNGVPSLTLSSSPSLGSKRPPSVSASPSFGVNGVTTNGTATRTSMRQRKESQRPSQSRHDSRSITLDTPNDSRGAPKKLTEPYVRTTEFILKKFKGKPPSLVLHLHPTNFRFDQQDGSFGYNSPMKIILEHLKLQTVPYNMLEELFMGNVPFYDGCLIVEVHDHKSVPAVPRNTSAAANHGNNFVPFSIHNYNEHVTPSPYVPYPNSYQIQPQSNTSEAEARGDQQTWGEEPMTAPNGVSGNVGKGPATRSRIFTTVLHPTPQSRHRELSILATTLAPEVSRAPNRRQVSVSTRDGATPLSAHPATPLSSIPPTPKTGKVPPAKIPKMMLEEKDFHDFEAEVLKYSEAPLLLEPAESFEDAQAIMRSLTHPLHNQMPLQPRGRKRTIAELAADEAQAAEDERFSLAMDGRLKPSLSIAGANASSTDTQSSANDFQPNFTSFKRLEDIRREFEEETQRKMDQERRALAAKKYQQQLLEQQQQEELQRRREAEELARQEQGRQAQRQAMQHAQLANMRGNQIPPHMVSGVPQSFMNQVSQGQHASPIMRNNTPITSSPLAGNLMNNQSAVSMAQSLSSQGPGSPLRPGSAIQTHSVVVSAPMGRQISQQLSQSGQSRTGTPQNLQATPHMSNGMPARHMTPQPSMAQGSPAHIGMHMGMQNNIPHAPNIGMQGVHQANGQPVTNHQVNAARRAQMLARQQQLQGSPNVNQMSPQQQQALMHAQHVAQTQHNIQGTPGTRGGLPQKIPLQNMTPEQQQKMFQQEYNKRLAAAQTQQMQAQIRNRVNQQSPPQHPQSFLPASSGQGFPNTPAMSAAAISPNLSQTQFMQQQQQQHSSQPQHHAQNMHMPQQPGQQQRNAFQALTPQQQQAFVVAQRNRQQAQAADFSRFCQHTLAPRNNNQVPPNAHQLYYEFKQQQQQQAQRQMQQIQQQAQVQALAQGVVSGQNGAVGGVGGGGMSNGMGQIGGQHAGVIDPAYAQRLLEHRAALQMSGQMGRAASGQGGGGGARPPGMMNGMLQQGQGRGGVQGN